MRTKTKLILAALACISSGCASPVKPAATTAAPAQPERYQFNYVLVPAETDSVTGRVFPAEERIVPIRVP